MPGEGLKPCRIPTIKYYPQSVGYVVPGVVICLILCSVNHESYCCFLDLSLPGSSMFLELSTQLSLRLEVCIEGKIENNEIPGRTAKTTLFFP